ncbi:piggyBac transposable element-derived protein 4-like [Sitophilus oryzae]|uniref:PiggyBac transposable element-derived protein 4-like n=1 Tax=Sitophilus oryzae TaxID=7048 RepID=A0A6J2Y779_SITOR|nr:piggyBac transposable element-derived protein 4-like [Sitophilus oryzae]
MSDSKKRKTEHSRDPAKWLEWYEESSDEEPPREETDSEEEDFVIRSDHNSDSEQDVDILAQDEDMANDGNLTKDDNMTEDAGIQNSGENIYFVAKDGITKWRKMPPPTNVRTKSCNIIIHLPGPKGAAREKKSEIDIYNLFLDDSIINIIVTSTNIYIDKIRSKFARERDARYTDSIEIRSFIGLLYLIGTLRSSRKNLSKLWDNSRGNGLEACYLTMSEKRFRFLIRCLRFDNIQDRPARRELDKLAAIREVLELFNNKFQSLFTPGEYLTVDEQLLAFRGNCSFRQYIPSKPAKYGLKVFAMCDSKTAYTVSLEPYVGKQPPGPYEQSNSGEDIVLRLVAPVEGTNRNITADNWFTSLSLAKSLKTKKLTYVGTIRANKRELPKEFLPSKTREIKSSLFGFQDDATLVSYCPKKNKSVLVLSTMHFDNAIDDSTGIEKKPDIITFYNMTKIGVDLLDQLCQNYDVSRNSRRWPMVLFYDFLNISAINAYCIHKYHSHGLNKCVKRANFLETVSWELIKPQIHRRSEIQSLPVEIRRRSKILVGVQDEPTPQEDKTGSRGRCFVCGRSRNKTTRRWCVKCGKWACGDHLKDVCVDCYENA